MPRPPNPQTISDQLAAVVSLLADHGEERWVQAFGRVQEHVTVMAGAADPLSTARVVRDLLHMFRGGLGPFAGWELRTDGEVDAEATARLAVLWTALRDEIAGQLGHGE